MTDFRDPLDTLPDEDIDAIIAGLPSDSDRPARAAVSGRADVRQREPPWTLRELLDRPELLEPPRVIIPWLAYLGVVTLVAAREKCGKSTLLGQAVAALTVGKEFLGEPLECSRVLWYALDEPLTDAVRRFVGFGADPDGIAFQTERPSAEQMRSEIVKTGAKVVVVDTLSRLWRGFIESANNNEQLAAFLWPYIEVCREMGVALVLLYHTNKGGREYRGGIELGASVDIPLTLRKRGQKQSAEADDGFDADYDDDSHDDGRRLLGGKGRGVEVKLRLTFDGTRYALGDAPMPLRSRILAELAHNPASANVLADILTARKDSVLAEIRDLRSEGMIEAYGAGARQVYHLTQLAAAATR